MLVAKREASRRLRSARSELLFGAIIRSIVLERCSPGFERLLESPLLDAVERHAGTVYGMWPDSRLAYFNPAWEGFALENGGDPSIAAESYLGTSVLAITPEVLRPFYRECFHACLHPAENMRRPVQVRYQCSSAELFRELVMTLYRLKDAAGLLAVHALVVECPHDPDERIPRDPDTRELMDDDGLIHQCAHCRRVKNLTQPHRWDWVPRWVERVPRQSSHTLCHFCLQQYYLDPCTERPGGDAPASATTARRSQPPAVLHDEQG